MLFKEEKAYLAIANDIIENGSTHKDRTGVGTRAGLSVAIPTLSTC